MVNILTVEMYISQEFNTFLSFLYVSNIDLRQQRPHYENLPMQYIDFFSRKNIKFHQK